MGFSVGGGLTAIATGGLSELPKLFGGKTSTATQVPLETTEQQQARQMLMTFAQTGRLGSFTAGDAISGYTPGAALPEADKLSSVYGQPMGDYGMTGLESAGQNKLQALLNSGNPEVFNSGTTAINNLLTGDKFDPYSSTGEFSGYKADAERQAQDAADALKRNSAFGGTLYNSDTTRSLGRLGEVTSTNLQNKLAELYQTYVQNKISAIPLALQAGQTQENMAQGRIAASQQYGGLSRVLNDTNLQRQYQEVLRANTAGAGEAVRRRGEVTADASRRRTEQQLPLNVLSSVAGQNANFGVPSVEVPVANPWDKVLDLLAKAGGSALGARAAA